MGEGQQDSGRRRADGPVVGLTGARFGGAAGRRRREKPPEPQQPAAIPEQEAPRLAPDGRVIGQTGARFGGQRRAASLPDDEPRVESATPAALNTTATADALLGSAALVYGDRESVPDESAWAEEGDDAEASYGLVRPYAWTGGRTAPAHELAMEALVSATGRAIDPGARPEHHTILTLCTTPRSVAELAAMLAVPLGVARVVLGDMAAAGTVTVHATAGSDGSPHGGPDLALLQRVLHCLHRL